jgi:hypothetical protein
MRPSQLKLAAALATGLALAACGGNAPPPAATPASVAPPAAAAAPAAAPNVADLVGARASSGEGEMERRGFTAARTRGLTTNWWHAPSRSCVQTTTANGRYRMVRAVAASNCGH